MQFDWLPDTPWGDPACVLVGALSHSSKCRGVFSDGHTTGHITECLDGVLRRIGGTTRRWRTDRMAGVVIPGTKDLTPAFADVAKFYGAAVDICPRGRAKRKGVVEAANKYLTQGWWRSAEVGTPERAQESLDSFCRSVADQRQRGDTTVAGLADKERLGPLPATPYPAIIEVTSKVTPSALGLLRRQLLLGAAGAHRLRDDPQNRPQSRKDRHLLSLRGARHDPREDTQGTPRDRAGARASGRARSAGARRLQH